MNNIDLPQQIQYLITEMSNEKTRPELRANYMLTLKDIRDLLDSEIEKFEKVYYK